MLRAVSKSAAKMPSSNEAVSDGQRRSLRAVVWDGVLIISLVLFALAFVVVPLAIVWRDQGGFIAVAIIAVIALAVWAQMSPLLTILKGLNESLAWQSIAYGVIAFWILAILCRVDWVRRLSWRGAVLVIHGRRRPG
jgi:hypothetical protein